MTDGKHDFRFPARFPCIRSVHERPRPPLGFRFSLAEASGPPPLSRFPILNMAAVTAAGPHSDRPGCPILPGISHFSLQNVRKPELDPCPRIRRGCAYNHCFRTYPTHQIPSSLHSHADTQPLRHFLPSNYHESLLYTVPGDPLVATGLHRWRSETAQVPPVASQPRSGRPQSLPA